MLSSMKFFDTFADKSVKMEIEAENTHTHCNQKHFALVNSIENPTEAQPF